jgi:hypothetical protein
VFVCVFDSYTRGEVAAPITVERHEVEVAVHQNGQTATSFFTATSPTSCEKRGGCLSIKMNRKEVVRSGRGGCTS